MWWLPRMRRRGEPVSGMDAPVEDPPLTDDDFLHALRQLWIAREAVGGHRRFLELVDARLDEWNARRKGKP